MHIYIYMIVIILHIILYSQVDLEGTGVVAYENAVTLVPDLLFQLFALRAQQSMVRMPHHNNIVCLIVYNYVDNTYLS